jgi:glycosyltransferase involved in cell wall biosynthesis
MGRGGLMPVKAAVVYWGSKGGGPRQLLNLIDSLNDSDDGLFFYISSNNELITEIESRPITNLEVNQLPTKVFQVLLNFRLRNRTIKKMIEDFEKNEITRVYFLLPHPWDLSLAKRIIKQGGIEVWRGIHDVRRHPGDMWPTGFTIQKLITYSTSLVCFSEHIEKKLTKSGKPLVRTFLFEVNQEPKYMSSEGSVLFVGRIRKYKGLDLLAKSWPLVSNPKKSLTVAGKGADTPRLQQVGANIVDKWLSNSEIEDLIRNSKLVVLPYIEASQSGVIAIAHSLSTPVVVTPVGGLIDQVSIGKNGLIARTISPESLAEAIDQALLMDWKLEDEENPLPAFLLKLQAD